MAKMEREGLVLKNYNSLIEYSVVKKALKSQVFELPGDKEANMLKQLNLLLEKETSLQKENFIYKLLELQITKEADVLFLANNYLIRLSTGTLTQIAKILNDN